jgi:hypothetical protein
MAGAAAEYEFFGTKSRGDSDDKLQIARMLSEIISEDQWKKVEPRLRAFTRQLVHRHKALIERVAKTLLAKTTVSAHQLDKIVGRSVADVRPSPPSALVMDESEQKELRAALDKLALEIRAKAKASAPGDAAPSG